MKRLHRIRVSRPAWNEVDAGRVAILFAAALAIIFGIGAML